MKRIHVITFHLVILFFMFDVFFFSYTLYYLNKTNHFIFFVEFLLDDFFTFDEVTKDQNDRINNSARLLGQAAGIP